MSSISRHWFQDLDAAAPESEVHPRTDSEAARTTESENAPRSREAPADPRADPWTDLPSDPSPETPGSEASTDQATEWSRREFCSETRESASVPPEAEKSEVSREPECTTETWDSRAQFPAHAAKQAATLAATESEDAAVSVPGLQPAEPQAQVTPAPSERQDSSIADPERPHLQAEVLAAGCPDASPSVHHPHPHRAPRRSRVPDR